MKFWGPYPYRSAFHSTNEKEECERALQHLEDVLMVEGPHTVAMIGLETVIGTNGILVPPDGYLQGVRDLCTKYGIVMMCDEVMAGFGRCGEWFAVNKWHVTPDLICFAKGVNSGYVPLGGVVISQKIADTFKERVYPRGLTYMGHPLACAAAVASINIFKEEKVLEHVRRMAEHVIAPELDRIKDKHPSVGDVRGVGMFWAIELVRNRDTRQPYVPFNAAGADAKPMAEFAAACKERGLWPFTHFNRVHVVPPCTTSEADLRTGLAIIDDALSIADKYYVAEPPLFGNLYGVVETTATHFYPNTVRGHRVADVENRVVLRWRRARRETLQCATSRRYERLKALAMAERKVSRIDDDAVASTPDGRRCAATLAVESRVRPP